MKKFIKEFALILAIVTIIAIYAPIGRMAGINNETVPSSPPSTNGETVPQQTTVPTLPTTVPTQPIETIPTTQPTEPEPTMPTEPPTFEIKMSFTGDMMLASNKDQTTENNFNGYASRKEPDYFLEKVREIFENDDFTIVNLENVFSDRNLKAAAKDHNPAYWFKSKTSNVEILASSSVEGVSLSNNHTFDYGQAGFDDTVAAVTNAGLQYGYKSQIMYFEKNGFRIAVICSGLWAEYQADTIIQLLKTASENSDYQVVFFHGGTEKIHEPEKWKVRAAHKLVDAGADLVIGGHPHVLQPREVYNGVEIVYSLGNFCYGGHSHPENRTIIYQMTLTINANNDVESSQSNIIPCYVYTGSRNNYQPTPIENADEIKKVIDFMEGLTELP